MAEGMGQAPSKTIRKQLKRRGLIASVAALSAVLASKMTTRTAEAADGSPLIIGQQNTSTNNTFLTRSSSTPSIAYTMMNETGEGIHGGSNSSGGVGVHAEMNNSNGIALWATTPGSSANLAGRFKGHVLIEGDFSATGMKSAVIPLTDGTHRRLYCQESPEPWFEDFGEAALTNGHAVVQLDPEFDAVVIGDSYQVFLTEYGDLGSLYVSDRRPHRFEVRSRSNASGTFGYRVVARRRDLAEKGADRRLERVNFPDTPRGIHNGPGLREPR
jgi:hypothetical protein